jgi:hypothetical protein
MHQREAILEKEFSNSRFNFFVLMENLAKQLFLVAQSILKLSNPQGKRLEGKIFTYIGVGDVS